MEQSRIHPDDYEIAYNIVKDAMDADDFEDEVRA